MTEHDREVGNGFSEGFALSRGVVVEKQQGTVQVESTIGKDTTFIINLPAHSSCHFKNSS